ncbi:MAG: hypothetical protein EBZ47_06185 [Chlamydiae bacterium]|nr:hypothetical protein [Chlamydiota bacterium]
MDMRKPLKIIAYFYRSRSKRLSLGFTLFLSGELGFKVLEKLNGIKIEVHMTCTSLEIAYSQSRMRPLPRSSLTQANLEKIKLCSQKSLPIEGGEETISHYSSFIHAGPQVEHSVHLVNQWDPLDFPCVQIKELGNSPSMEKTQDARGASCRLYQTMSSIAKRFYFSVKSPKKGHKL